MARGIRAYHRAIPPHRPAGGQPAALHRSVSDRSFDRNRQDSRGQVYAIGPAKRDKSKERSQRGESSIPRTDAVVALRFEVVEKRQDHRRIEIVERQRIRCEMPVLL
jgi:hypothetical protein